MVSIQALIYASGDWSQVSLRVPAIANTVRYTYETDASVQEEYEDWEDPGSDEELKWLVLEVKRKEKRLLFVVDERTL